VAGFHLFNVIELNFRKLSSLDLLAVENFVIGRFKLGLAFRGFAGKRVGWSSA
jgi:hypothetical protein